MKKDRGFTLIELLAVIVIMAIIALIVTPIVVKMVNKAKIGVMERNAEMMAKSGELYAVDNLDKLPKEGNTKYLAITDLVSGGYLSSIKDPYETDAGCEGFVKVKNENGEYKFTPYLDCGGSEQLRVDESYVRFGGVYNEHFEDIEPTSDGGFIAVGKSNSASYFGLTEKNSSAVDYDGVIVKYSATGEIEFTANFGGTKDDEYRKVIEVDDGYVVTGRSYSSDGDLTNRDNYDLYGFSSDLEANISYFESIAVKYDKNLNLVTFKKYYSANSWAIGLIDIIEYGDGYITTGSNDSNKALIYKLDTNLNIVGESPDNFDRNTRAYKLLLNESGNLILGGYRYSDGTYLYEDINPGYGGAFIIEMNPDTYEVLKRAAIPASVTRGDTHIIDYIEFADFYIAVGNTSGNSFDFLNQNHSGDAGYTDVFVMKFDKNNTSIASDVNGNTVTSSIPVMNKELVTMLGGTDADVAEKIIKIDETKFAVIGYTESSDFDFQGINKANKNYKDAFILVVDINGNVLDRKTLGGTNSDLAYDIIKDEDGGYIYATDSFSTDGNLAPFDYGNADSVIYKLDSNFNPLEEFKIPTYLKNDKATFVSNYGTSIPLPSGRDTINVYTTKDPAVDLKGWCTNYDSSDPNANYPYAACLAPFNGDDEIRASERKEVILGVNDYAVDIVNSKNWLKLGLAFGNYGAQVEIDTLRIHFEDGYTASIETAVNDGYIEPLVLWGHNSTTHYFANSYEIIKGNTSGVGGTYPSLQIFIKPKISKVSKIVFNSSHGVPYSGGGFYVNELNNFDMSLSQGN